MPAGSCTSGRRRSFRLSRRAQRLVADHERRSDASAGRARSLPCRHRRARAAGSDASFPHRPIPDDLRPQRLVGLGERTPSAASLGRALPRRDSACRPASRLRDVDPAFHLELMPCGRKIVDLLHGLPRKQLLEVLAPLLRHGDQLLDVVAVRRLLDEQLLVVAPEAASPRGARRPGRSRAPAARARRRRAPSRRSRAPPARPSRAYSKASVRLWARTMSFRSGKCSRARGRRCASRSSGSSTATTSSFALRGARRLQQVEARGVAVVGLAAEAAHQLDLVRVVVDDRGADLHAVQHARHDLAEAAEAGDDHRVLLVDRVRRALLGAREARREHALVEHHAGAACSASRRRPRRSAGRASRCGRMLPAAPNSTKANSPTCDSASANSVASARPQ